MRYIFLRDTYLSLCLQCLQVFGDHISYRFFAGADHMSKTLLLRSALRRHVRGGFFEPAAHSSFKSLTQRIQCFKSNDMPFLKKIETSEIDLGFESQSPQTMSNPVKMIKRNGNHPQFRQDIMSGIPTNQIGFNGNRHSFQ